MDSTQLSQVMRTPRANQHPQWPGLPLLGGGRAFKFHLQLRELEMLGQGFLLGDHVGKGPLERFL